MKKKIPDLAGQDVLFRDIPALEIPAGEEKCGMCEDKRAIVCRTREGIPICRTCWDSYLITIDDL